jgi:hypothetical protein
MLAGSAGCRPEAGFRRALLAAGGAGRGSAPRAVDLGAERVEQCAEALGPVVEQRVAGILEQSSTRLAGRAARWAAA